MKSFVSGFGTSLGVVIGVVVGIVIVGASILALDRVINGPMPSDPPAATAN